MALFFYLNYNCIHLCALTLHCVLILILILNYTTYCDKLCMPCNQLYSDNDCTLFYSTN